MKLIENSKRKSAEVLKHMNEFEKNQKWYAKNFKKLLRNYNEKFVAISSQKLIDFDENLERLSKRIRNEKKKGTYVSFVSDKPLEMIL